MSYVARTSLSARWSGGKIRWAPFYIVFVAHALHEHPASKLMLEAGDSAYQHAFVQEVRRYYHRCPGEWITIELMRQALQFFVADVRYNVPPQDLSVDTTRLPALPSSRFVLSSIELR